VKMRLDSCELLIKVISAKNLFLSKTKFNSRVGFTVRQLWWLSPLFILIVIQLSGYDLGGK